MLIKSLLNAQNTSALTAKQIDHLTQGSELEQALWTAHTQQNFAPFYEQLKQYLIVSTIAGSVQDFVESTASLEKVLGPLALGGVSTLINDKQLFPYSQLFKNTSFEGRFPAFYLDSDIWLMIPSGRILNLSHDGSLHEEARDILKQGKTRDEFVEALTAVGSTLDITQYVQLQTRLFEAGIHDLWDIELEHQETTLRILGDIIHLPLTDLNDSYPFRGLDFIYEPCREYIEENS